MNMASHFFTLFSVSVLILSFVVNFSFLPNTLAATTHSNKTSHHHTRNHSRSSSHKLQQAYLALQAWKRVIYSDPTNFTSNWVGPSVCSYKGVYCASPPHDPDVDVVAGIDLNHADIAGFLPKELGLLSDLALLHVNSNRFCGIIPKTFSNLTFLYELDVSNNRFVGPFPSVVLSLPVLKFLDLRYNDFEGPLPPQLFNKDLDAIFVNNNRFTSVISSNFTGTSASVVVFANNNLKGCIPPSIAKFADTLEELLLSNTSLTGCIPPEVGYLYKLKVLDVSNNNLVGPIPYSIAGLTHLEQLNLGHNQMSGVVPLDVCVLPDLENFTLSYNYFYEEEGICRNLTSKGVVFDDRRNCLPDKRLQRSRKDCDAVLVHHVDCFKHPCDGSSSSSSSFGGPPAFAPAMVPATSPLLSPSTSLAPGPGFR